ncbi:hypothetical protein G3I01_03945 [Gramella sp. MT6]|nr:hypothetical protein G3I01_03945 [Gramella sp. MT6]
MLVLITCLSCSSDDTDESCELEIWGMSFSSSSGKYIIDYGPDENNTQSIEVDKYTYDYYVGITEDDNPEDCWEGPK